MRTKGNKMNFDPTGIVSIVRRWTSNKTFQTFIINSIFAWIFVCMGFSDKPEWLYAMFTFLLHLYVVVMTFAWVILFIFGLLTFNMAFTSKFSTIDVTYKVHLILRLMDILIIFIIYHAGFYTDGGILMIATVLGWIGSYLIIGWQKRTLN